MSESEMDEETTRKINELPGMVRGLLSETFGVDPERIEVRVSVASRPDAKAALRIETELDGKTPPKAWSYLLEELLGTVGAVCEAMGLGPVKITSGASDGLADADLIDEDPEDDELPPEVVDWMRNARSLLDALLEETPQVASFLAEGDELLQRYAKTEPAPAPDVAGLGEPGSGHAVTPVDDDERMPWEEASSR